MCGIGGADGGLAVDKATVFVKIGSFGYVRGDDGTSF